MKGTGERGREMERGEMETERAERGDREGPRGGIEKRSHGVSQSISK